VLPFGAACTVLYVRTMARGLAGCKNTELSGPSRERLNAA